MTPVARPSDAADSGRYAATLLVPALVLALALPAHAFLLGRAGVARGMGMNPVYEWIRKPAADEAKRELGLQNAILGDLAKAGETLPADAVLGFYEPSYIALLADRRAVQIPWPMDSAAWDAARRAGATHVYLSRIHPRMSRALIDGLAINGSLPTGVDVLWCSQEVLNHQPAGCLYALPSAKAY